MQVFIAASQGIHDKQLIAAAKMAYDVIHLKFDAVVKTHINLMETSFANQACYYKEGDKCLGDLSFVNPSIYLRSMDPSHSDSGRMITPADKNLAYKFFMIRGVVGAFARKLEPDWVVTFKQTSMKTYGNNDVLGAFKYINAQSAEIKGHSGGAPNQVAIQILKADKSEVEKLVYNVFEEFTADCNKLKETTTLHHQVTVCQNRIDIGNPDYFLELLTCLEMFNLVTQGSYCKELVYAEEFDW